MCVPFICHDLMFDDVALISAYILDPGCNTLRLDQFSLGGVHSGTPGFGSTSHDMRYSQVPANFTWGVLAYDHQYGAWYH